MTHKTFSCPIYRKCLDDFKVMHQPTLRLKDQSCCFRCLAPSKICRGIFDYKPEKCHIQGLLKAFLHYLWRNFELVEKLDRANLTPIRPRPDDTPDARDAKRALLYRVDKEKYGTEVIPLCDVFLNVSLKIHDD